jgi:hypothetical protein
VAQLLQRLEQVVQAEVDDVKLEQSLLVIWEVVGQDCAHVWKCGHFIQALIPAPWGDV